MLHLILSRIITTLNKHYDSCNLFKDVYATAITFLAQVHKTQCTQSNVIVSAFTFKFRPLKEAQMCMQGHNNHTAPGYNDYALAFDNLVD